MTIDMKTKKLDVLYIRIEEKLRRAILRECHIKDKSQAQIIREHLYSLYNYDPKKDEFIK